MTTETHTAAQLLTGPTFYQFDHFIEINGVSHKITAVHRPDTSTAHYWDGRDNSDVLLSIRPCTRLGLGDQVKHMVSDKTELTAKAAA